jgi:Raf kinase inhibitor-like YbhB/YbcL family protein
MKFLSTCAALLLVGAVPAAACAASADQVAISNPALKGKATLNVSSPVLRAGAPIPEEFTSYGKNVSPPLGWSRAPYGSRSFALVLEDPDAPMASPFVHWIMWSIPLALTSFKAGETPTGAVQGRMGVGRVGYFGPRPPAGPAHHYHFEVFALDQTPDLKSDADFKALTAAMAGHVLASGELVATYQKK